MEGEAEVQAQSIKVLCVPACLESVKHKRIIILFTHDRPVMFPTKDLFLCVITLVAPGRECKAIPAKIRNPVTSNPFLCQQGTFVFGFSYFVLPLNFMYI